MIMFNLCIYWHEIFISFLLIFCYEFFYLIFVTISNFEICLKFLLRFILGLSYFYLPFFKFLPVLETLSYSRKSYFLNNACSFLLNFKGNLFELAKLFFVRIKRLGSQSSLDIWFLQKCFLSISLAWLFFLLQTDALFFILYYYILMDMKLDSAMIESNQLSGSARVNSARVNFWLCFS